MSGTLDYHYSLSSLAHFQGVELWRQGLEACLKPEFQDHTYVFGARPFRGEHRTLKLIYSIERTAARHRIGSTTYLSLVPARSDSDYEGSLPLLFLKPNLYKEDRRLFHQHMLRGGFPHKTTRSSKDRSRTTRPHVIIT